MRCEHFEREGLARIEAGKPDPHVDECADCQAARATYLKLTDALADVGAEVQPKAGWQDEVLAKIRRSPRAPRASSKVWWMGAGFAAAAAAATVLLLTRPRVPATSIARVVGASTVRGDQESWKTDDTLVARSRVAGGAVWVYRDDARVMGCDADHLRAVDPADGDQFACARHGRGVRATMRTRLRGTYVVFAFKQAPGTASPATLDEAAALVIRDQREVDKRTFTVR